jgi:hypothetical protein
MANNSRSIKRLIYRGADVYMKNNKGENAFDIVNKNNKLDNDKKLEIKEILNRKYRIYRFIYIIYIRSEKCSMGIPKYIKWKFNSSYIIN